MSMTREAALDQAIANCCAGAIADYGHGLIDRERLDKDIRRRMPEITAMVRELLEIAERAPALCCRCAVTATTVIGGEAYCEAHAAAAPRMVAS